MGRLRRRARDTPEDAQAHQTDRGGQRRQRTARQHDWPLGPTSSTPQRVGVEPKIGATSADVCHDLHVEHLSSVSGTGSGPTTSASLQNMGRMASIFVHCRAFNADPKKSLRTTIAPNFGPLPGDPGYRKEVCAQGSELDEP